MKGEFTKVLQEAGFNEIEAAIYSVLLKSQKMTISEIARAAGVKRPTCYQYLDALLSKDFVVRIPIGKRMFYGAASPKKILASAKKRFSIFEAAVEEMSKQHETSTNKPKVVFYEGKRELKNIYEDLFKTIGDIFSIFPPAAFFENFTEQEYNEFDSSISQYAIKSKDLIVGDKFFKTADRIRKKNGMDNKLTKKLPESFKSNVDVLVYGNKVALISLRDLSAIVVESKDIAELFKSLHATIWRET
jgi:sugar-specific transcriptional regulator TrmB